MANCCNQYYSCRGTSSRCGYTSSPCCYGGGSNSYFGGNGTPCGCGAYAESASCGWNACGSRNSCCGCNTCCRGPQGPTGPRGPQGIAGPQGPQGPAGTAPTGVAAYGGLYNTATQTPTITAANTYVPLTLNAAMPAANVTNGANTLTITQAGDYEVIYNVLMNTSAAASVAAAVRRNGAEIPQTRAAQTMAVDTTTNTSYDGRLAASTIVTLAPGDVLDLAIQVQNTLPAGLTATVGSNANAILTVKKLNASTVIY